MIHLYSITDLALIILFFITIISVGIFTGKNTKTINDFVLYYRNLNPYIIGVSLLVVMIGPNSVFGNINEIRTVGIICSVVSLTNVINHFIVAKFIIPKFDHRFSNMISVCDIFKHFLASLEKNYQLL